VLKRSKTASHGDWLKLPSLNAI